MRTKIKNKNNNKIKLTVKLVIAFLLLYYLVNYVDYNQIISAFYNSNKFILLLVFFLSFLNIYLQFLKWEVVCNSVLKIYDAKKIWLSLFYGLSGGIATPIRLGEYVGRKIPFENIGLMKVTIATLTEKFTSLVIVLIIGAAVSFFFVSYYFSFWFASPLVLFIVLLTGLIFIFFKGYYTTNKWLNALASRLKFVENILSEIQYIKQLGSQTLIKLIYYSFIFYLLIIIQYGLLVLAFEDNGNFLNYLASGAIVMFVKSILSFISFADLGIRESTSVFVLDKMGYSKAIGFNSAIFLFLFNVLIPSLIGLFLLFKKEK